MKDCCKIKRTPVIITTLSGEPVVISSPTYHGELKGTYCEVCGEVRLNAYVSLEDEKDRS